jgi:hypothetical protein
MVWRQRSETCSHSIDARRAGLRASAWQQAHERFRQFQAQSLTTANQLPASRLRRETAYTRHLPRRALLRRTTLSVKSRGQFTGADARERGVPRLLGDLLDGHIIGQDQAESMPNVEGPPQDCD